jgi:hypothetical protein
MIPSKEPFSGADDNAHSEKKHVREKDRASNSDPVTISGVELRGCYSIFNPEVLR